MAITIGIECSQVCEHVTTEQCVCYKGWGLFKAEVSEVGNQACYTKFGITIARQMFTFQRVCYVSWTS